MKLEHMKLFSDVARSGSIGQAAKSNYITQQGVSAAISKIEKELDIELLLRSNKGVALTRDGQKFYECADKLLRIYDDFLYSIHESNDNNVYNIYLSGGMSTIPHLNETPLAGKYGCYFSYIERPVMELVDMINKNRGICFLLFHSGFDSAYLNKVDKELRMYEVGYSDELVFVCSASSDLRNYGVEELQAIYPMRRCVLMSSEYDLVNQPERLRNAVCLPDLENYKNLLKHGDTYSMMTRDMYRMHFSSEAYCVLESRKLEKRHIFYAIFNLKKNERNLFLERDLVAYLKEIFQKAVNPTV